jgi:signal transduction histidine kinase
MSIQGYAEGIAAGVVPDTAKAAEIIGGESKRLNMLVEELLTLSRIENQAYGQLMQPLNVGDILREVAQRLGGYASKVNKNLKLDISQQAVIALADETLLSQAVINIASNCLRYAKTEVKISLTADNMNAIIHISDDGSGIDSADLPHLFERFIRVREVISGLALL